MRIESQHGDWRMRSKRTDVVHQRFLDVIVGCDYSVLPSQPASQIVTVIIRREIERKTKIERERNKREKTERERDEKS